MVTTTVPGSAPGATVTSPMVTTGRSTTIGVALAADGSMTAPPAPVSVMSEPATSAGVPWTTTEPLPLTEPGGIVIVPTTGGTPGTVNSIVIGVVDGSSTPTVTTTIDVPGVG